jgi:uncharacterized protein (DUF2132 family)
MNYRISKNFNVGNIDGNIVFNKNMTKVRYNETIKYWGIKYLIIPWKKEKVNANYISSKSGFNWCNVHVDTIGPNMHHFPKGVMDIIIKEYLVCKIEFETLMNGLEK